MNRTTNQTIERYYFEQFRSHYQLPDGEVEYSDQPDVLIRGVKTVGIEIANLYITSGSDQASEQVQRVRRQRVLDRAQILYAAGGKRIELSVDFRPEQPIREIESVARGLADLAQTIQDLPAGPVNPVLLKPIPEVRFIYKSANEDVDPKWRIIQCYSVPSLSIDRLREVVAEKSEKVEVYQPCESYWLLLVVDFADRAQDQELQWDADAQLGKSRFERILLYKPQFAQVVQVVP